MPRRERTKAKATQKRMSPIPSLLRRGAYSGKALRLGLLRISNLGMQKRRDRLPLLMKLAKHEISQVRSTAIWSLGAIGDKRALPTIRRALKDPDESVRKTAENALKSMFKIKLK